MARKADKSTKPREQQEMFDSGSSAKKRRPAKGSAHLKGTRALERLRERVDLAAREIIRLRAENVELHRKVDGFQSEQLEPVEGTQVVFNDSAEALRSKIDGFIEAIDEYMGNGSDSVD